MKISITAMAKESSRGVFWYIDNELLAFPYGAVNSVDGIAKSGLTYNHKRLWLDVKPRSCSKPYNYYPRGRVDFNGSGKAIIYMNPNIPESVIPEIKVEFGIRNDNYRLVYDNSSHYLCYLDDGWKPDN